MGPTAMPGDRAFALNSRGSVAPSPSCAPSGAPAAASTSASSIATVSSTSTSSSENSRGARFCTTSTPWVRPARRTGSAIREANGSSPVSAR